MEFQLRDYQLKAVDRTMESLSQNHKVGLILPTGSGKTEVFIEVCKRFQDDNPRKSVLILSHLSLLTEQTLQRFTLRSPQIRTGVLQANVRPYILSDVIVGTMQTSRIEARAKYLTDRMIRKVGLIVVDEAHYMPTDSYQKIFKYHPDAKILGCTATPYSGNKLMTNQFDTISYSLSLEHLIKEGHLVPPNLIELSRVSSEISEVMAQVCSVYREREFGNRAIVFMKTKKECRQLRELFESFNIPAEVIIADNGGQYREEAITKFKEGTTKVLITVNVLTAGFDCPSVQSIFMPYAVGSVATYIQRIGRGLRNCSEIGKRECRVYCFGDSPKISNGLYRKVANLALNAGGKIKEYDTITDTLEFNEWEMFEHKERYIWTQAVAEAVKKMHGSKYPAIADMLNHKNFPDVFMKDISDIIYKMPIRSIAPQFKGKPITFNQERYLRERGFSDSAVKSIDKRDACLLLSILEPNKSGPYIAQSGNYAGYHVSVLPHAYATAIMKSYPNSQIATAIRSWRERENHERSSNRAGYKSGPISSNG